MIYLAYKEVFVFNNYKKFTIVLMIHVHNWLLICYD